jgi:hypothetical protein
MPRAKVGDVAGTRLLRRGFLAIVLAGAAATAGCLSPTLPLPPPEQPEMSAVDGEGYVTIKGGPGSAEVGAIVFAYNERSGDGVIDTADGYGTYELRIQAVVGDRIAVWQEKGNERSTSLLLPVRSK